jgi:hypothetical protein
MEAIEGRICLRSETLKEFVHVVQAASDVAESISDTITDYTNWIKSIGSGVTDYSKSAVESATQAAKVKLVLL